MKLRGSRRALAVSSVLLLIAFGFGVYVFDALPFVPRTIAEVKYSVIAAIGPPLVCTGWGQPNPPFRPAETYPRIVADLPTYIAIRKRTGPFAPVDVVYREWLKLQAVRLDRHGATYDFQTFLEQPHPEAEENEVVGTVDLYGHVSNVRTGAQMGACLL
jgi:hypothetical protein